MTLETNLQTVLAFCAGAFFTKILQLVAERLFVRFCKISVLGTVALNYKPNESSYTYHESVKECVLDIPFETKVVLFNASHHQRTLHVPRLRLHQSIEAFCANTETDYGGAFLTTIPDRPIAIPANGHCECILKGWASFYSTGDCEDNLKKIAHRALHGVAHVTAHFRFADSKAELRIHAVATLNPFALSELKRDTASNSPQETG